MESSMNRPRYRAAVTAFIVAGLVGVVAARFPRDVLSPEPAEDDGFWKTAEPARIGI
jgi:hypothetical protein